MRGSLLLFALLTLIPHAAAAQGDPVGPEFRVNTFTGFEQFSPSVTADPAGNFVVVWTSYLPTSGFNVFGQRYASSGTPLGPEFRVNTYTTSYQSYPSVAADASGNFVVVWASFGQDGFGFGIFGQRYASGGGSLGPEFRGNTYTTSNQVLPSVAYDSLGNFVVVWQSLNQDGSFDGVFGQRYASTGAPLGPEFRVNTYTTGFQSDASVAADSSGKFVVVWTSQFQDGSSDGVFGQRYAASGTPLGSEFRVNTYTTSGQFSGAVVAEPTGNFVVVWQSFAQDGSGSGVFGQRYASSGAPFGSEFRVNSNTTSYQDYPSVAADSAGNFVVVWHSDAQDGSSFGIFGQRYASSGIPLGPEFRVNTYTTNAQRFPSVAADSSGDFVVVWQSLNQDGESEGVFGQRYSQIVPVELMHFRVE